MLRMFVYVFCAGVLLRARPRAHTHTHAHAYIGALTISPNVRLRLRGERAWLVYVCARTCVPHTRARVFAGRCLISHRRQHKHTHTLSEKSRARTHLALCGVVVRCHLSLKHRCIGGRCTLSMLSFDIALCGTHLSAHKRAHKKAQHNTQ